MHIAAVFAARRARPRSLFVPSIRNLISHESERRLSPFLPPPPTTFSLFSPLLPFLFLREKQTDAPERRLPAAPPSFFFPRDSTSTMARPRTCHSDELTYHFLLRMPTINECDAHFQVQSLS